MATRGTETFDLAVVGAGIVGLACDAEFARRRPAWRICVIERENELAQHQTGHNSGVVHAGIYYAPGLLKATLCRRGVGALHELCARRGVPIRRSGKVIVATSHDELPRLHALLDRGRRNGVPGLRLLDQDSLLEVEPHVRALAAIHSPTTAVVDFSRVCDALAADLHTSGHAIALGCEVSSVRRDRDGLTLAYGDGETRAKFALFCTGSWSDRLAPPDREVRIIPFRGQYFGLRAERRSLVRGLVYPAPDPALPFLGVHLTRHIDDTVSIGPTARLAGAYDGYSVRAIRARDLRAIGTWPGTYRLLWRYRRHVVTELGHTLSKRAVVRAAARMLPDLAPADVVRAEAGVRGQAVTYAGRLLDDFVFAESDRALHVRSAPSPAATAALAIADYVAARCERSWSV